MLEKRFTVDSGANPLSDVVLRAMQETGGWSVPAMRGPGFRMIDRILQEAGGFRALAPLP